MLELSHEDLVSDIFSSLSKISETSLKLENQGLKNFACLLKIANDNLISVSPESDNFLDEIGRSCKLIREIEVKLTEAGLTEFADDLTRERNIISKKSHSLMVDTQRIFIGIIPEKD